jgi:hypothetical protein
VRAAVRREKSYKASLIINLKNFASECRKCVRADFGIPSLVGLPIPPQIGHFPKCHTSKTCWTPSLTRGDALMR